MEKRIIYADNAATTQVSKPVLEAMLPYLTGQYGNPSSIYALGRHAQRDIELARQQVAEALGCEPGEIFFTGCGTESDNWAIRSTAARLGAKGKRHIVTSVFEHHAVLHTCAALEKEGFEVTYLPVSREGLLTAQQVADAIRPDTALVSIMYANNEIGTIQPISEIAAVCREKGVLFHTDAVQAVGHVPINVREQGIDMLSLSGHKLHAQKGIGALYVRKGVPLPNLLYGGAQERSRRPGTENVPAIVGLGTAITLAVENLEEKMERVTALRNRLIDGILTGCIVCPATAIFPFWASKGSSCCWRWINWASWRPAVPHAPAVLWIPPTFCFPWGCATRLPTALCGCPSPTKPAGRTWSISSGRCTRQRSGAEPCPLCGKPSRQAKWIIRISERSAERCCIVKR